ncbi:hypothetical protein EDI_287470 [Entamoeba dispar SAW760]|uniref:TLDc domain-containing protein n=1 Tax=Entamoeba dispar (strain ATCC PRA-260 / SAW760) TaxID=370354 RepID=B0E8M7_ENTDS|nr:uncharacterized protein EDI_287470 [Entamoeba dispar SAW760]EDR29117.1 hypothetical protein EDI_287470 [Entamoeba dispar SAW760]|eukprot:EDR29117.1 hypothetical protein EDI_287470 [Entamoeba dispar SAW760]
MNNITISTINNYGIISIHKNTSYQQDNLDTKTQHLIPQKLSCLQSSESVSKCATQPQTPCNPANSFLEPYSKSCSSPADSLKKVKTDSTTLNPSVISFLSKHQKQSSLSTTKLRRQTVDDTIIKQKNPGKINPSTSFTPLTLNLFQDPFEIVGLSKYETVLKQWIPSIRMKLIYDSSQQFFDSKGFNEKVCGRKNLLIIVVSGKSIFGSWHSKQIPKEKKDGFVYVKNDENHFVFTLRNIYNINPTKFLPREVNKYSKSLCLSGSKSSTCIVGCYSCYFVETLDNESTVDWSFSSTYRDTSGKGHLIFTGKQAFTTDRLLAFYGE